MNKCTFFIVESGEFPLQRRYFTRALLSTRNCVEERGTLFKGSFRWIHQKIFFAFPKYLIRSFLQKLFKFLEDIELQRRDHTARLDRPEWYPVLEILNNLWGPGNEQEQSSRLHRLAELINWNLGFLKVLKFGL